MTSSSRTLRGAQCRLFRSMAKAFFKIRVAVSVNLYFANSSSLAKVVNDYIMESRTLLPLVRPCGALHVNSVEDFDQLDHAYRETGLFQQFARHAFLQRLAQLQRSSWYRPFPKQRLAAASNQQRASLVDNYAAYANQRSFWILPRRCHLSAVYPFSGGLQIRRCPPAWG